MYPQHLPRRPRVDVILDLALVASLLLLPPLWFFERLPDSKELPHLSWTAAWFLLPLLLAAAAFSLREKRLEGGVPLVPRGRLLQMALRLSFAVTVPLVLLVMVETGLRAVGYHRALPPVVFETREPNADVNGNRVLTHPALLFTFNPGTVYNAVRINALGYREREVDPVKAPGTKRVICLGDSITAQGRPNYSGLLHERLQQDPPGDGAWEAFNMGVYGYSARQGLAVFRLQARHLQPDYITVYFGPNDRNLYEQTDKDRMAAALTGWKRLLLENFQEKRLGQYVLGKARDRAAAHYQKIGPDQRVLRVPPEDYRYVMRQFVVEAREAGAVAILLTAPRRALSPGLVSAKYAESVENAEARHDAYNQIVREVAAELGAPLLDLAERMSGPEFDAMFAEDGVHFDSYATEHARKPASQPGLSFIAESIHALLLELEGD